MSLEYQPWFVLRFLRVEVFRLDFSLDMGSILLPCRSRWLIQLILILWNVLSNYRENKQTRIDSISSSMGSFCAPGSTYGCDAGEHRTSNNIKWTSQQHQ